jgi:hypothetical protein
MTPHQPVARYLCGLASACLEAARRPELIGVAPARTAHGCPPAEVVLRVAKKAITFPQRPSDLQGTHNCCYERTRPVERFRASHQHRLRAAGEVAAAGSKKAICSPADTTGSPQRGRTRVGQRPKAGYPRGISAFPSPQARPRSWRSRR